MKGIATLAVVLGCLTWCEAQYTLEYAKLRSATALSGTVNDQGGYAIPDVRVSEMSSDWKMQLRSTTSDAQGKWSLHPFVSGKTYYIEFVKPNFNPVRIRVKIIKHGNGTVVVEMPVAT